MIISKLEKEMMYLLDETFQYRLGISFNYEFNKEYDIDNYQVKYSVEKKTRFYESMPNEITTIEIIDEKNRKMVLTFNQRFNSSQQRIVELCIELYLENGIILQRKFGACYFGTENSLRISRNHTNYLFTTVEQLIVGDVTIQHEIISKNSWYGTSNSEKIIHNGKTYDIVDFCSIVIDEYTFVYTVIDGICKFVDIVDIRETDTNYTYPRGENYWMMKKELLINLQRDSYNSLNEDQLRQLVKAIELSKIDDKKADEFKNHLQTQIDASQKIQSLKMNHDKSGEITKLAQTYVNHYKLFDSENNFFNSYDKVIEILKFIKEDQRVMTKKLNSTLNNLLSCGYIEQLDKINTNITEVKNN